MVLYMQVHLSIAELATGAELQRLRLPRGPNYCRPQDLLWLPDSSHLVARCGEAWALAPLQQDLRSIDPSSPTDLVFVDLQAASRTRVKLPPQRRLLLTGHPVQCAVSSQGSLVVLHVSRAGDVCLSVYSASGSLDASTTLFPHSILAGSDRLRPSHLLWGPDCRVVAFILASTDTTEAKGLCLWHPASEAEPNTLDLSDRLQPDGAGQLVFSPCSSRLLVQFDPTKTVIANLDLGEFKGQDVVTQTQGHMCSAWCLTGLVSLSRVCEEWSGYRECHVTVGKGLCWSSVQGGSVQPCLSVDLGSRVTELQAAACSPDGLHCALVSFRLQTKKPEKRSLVDPRLEVISLTAGRLFWVPLGTVPADRTWTALVKNRRAKVVADPTWQSYSIRWAPDGSALICSFSSGEEHLLVSFV